MPKSVTLTRPSSSRITLCGLRSRWTIPRLCAKRAARRIWIDDVDGQRRAAAAPRSRTISFSVVPLDVLHRDVGACRPTRRGRRWRRRSGAAGPRRCEASRRKRSTNCGSSAKRAVQQLERDAAAELLVLGAVDVGHAAGAEPRSRRGSARRRACRGSTGAPSLSPPATRGPAWRRAPRRAARAALRALDHDGDGVLGR